MIVVNLDVMMAKRKMTLSQLSEKVDVTLANLSILKNNKAKAVRFSTLEAICAAPGGGAGAESLPKPSAEPVRRSGSHIESPLRACVKRNPKELS